MTRASSGSIVAYGKFYIESITGPIRYSNILTAGFPREHFVIAWNRVDLPTFAKPTWLCYKR